MLNRVKDDFRQILRSPAFIIGSFGYFIATQYFNLFPTWFVIDLLLIGNIVWLFIENKSNLVFRRVLSHGISALSFMIIILDYYGTSFKAWVVWVAFIALAVNFSFMVYSSKYNSQEFIKASKIVLFLSRFKRFF